MNSLFLPSFFLGFISNTTAYPVTYEHVRGKPYTVSYDHRAIKIDGVRTMLISGAIHYPRSTPAMWPYLFQMAKKQGVLDFSGRGNLSQFLQDAADAGLFVNLRIGPYVCLHSDGIPNEPINTRI